MAPRTIASTIAAIALSACTALALEMETVPVGNPGNLPDTRYDSEGYGAVDYEYNIGRYEVTAGQYVEFLNAVAVTDTHGVYNGSMWSSTYGCKIERSGSSGNYAYSVAADRENRPVNHFSWYDAARFCNWLTTGDTEKGVYTFTDGSLTNILDHETAALTLGCTAWFIPTEDEWYKAAYHKNDGVTGNYFDYPTASDSEPSNDRIDPDPGNNANYYDGSYTIGSPYYTTEVGEFVNSESPYGTFDQGGNLVEWNETAIDWSRGLRGGEWGFGAGNLMASSRSRYAPTSEYSTFGFRVASIRVPDIPIAGDLDSDGLVSSRDLDIVRAWWGAEVEPGAGDHGDATGDGLVDSNDLDLVRSNWGAGTSAVPEPNTALLFVGALLLVWRRGESPPRATLFGLQGPFRVARGFLAKASSRKSI